MDTWATVENEYNTNFEGIVFRTATVLKNKYLNLKKNCKRKLEMKGQESEVLEVGPIIKLNTMIAKI